MREFAHVQLHSHAKALATERLCREGAQGPGDLGYAPTETECRCKVRSVSLHEIFMKKEANYEHGVFKEHIFKGNQGL